MSVDLQFYNEDSIVLREIDAGESRMNYGTITSLKLKNNGTDKARQCIIAASALNTIDELKEQYPEEEAEDKYNKQKLAASWKTFSLDKDGIFTPELSLGNIDAGSFLKGNETIKDDFSDPENSLFQDVWSYCLESRANNKLKIYKNEAKSQTAQRKVINVGKKRDIKIQFKLDYECDPSQYAKNNCLVIFPVRVDDRGYGYILSFQFRASDQKIYFGVYKGGKGMVDNLNRSYGTRIFDLNGFKSFDTSKFMGAHIFTNEEDETCFEFTLNGEKQILYKTGQTSIKGTTVVDTDNSYPNAGLMYFDVGMYYGDLAISLSNFTIETETDQQVVYVKSKITNEAIDNEDYTSAISVSYVER